jgi:glutamate--cysteine ligase regulatory subunit
MGGSSPILARASARSNAELTAALRLNITSHKEEAADISGSWTTQSKSDFYIPSLSPTPLTEDRSAYDITVKLFYLPHVSTDNRCEHTRDALSFVLTQLGISNVDLLIVSFPNITFDADDESSEDESPSASPSPLTTTPSISDETDAILHTWRTIEKLHDSATVRKLGLSEFGTQRLSRILASARVRPAVDQINVRDCCVVPKPLIMFAKQEKIELLTHNDCTDILPEGTLRELLGPGKDGAGVLAASATGEGGMKGEVLPLWVVKYTAVVKNRGVVENKGYFAAAELRE